MPKGYTDVEQITLYLGKTLDGVSTLTDDQQTQATSLLGDVEDYIDHQTKRSWLTLPQSQERHQLDVPWLNLTYAPVASVSAVSTRTDTIGEAPVLLTAGLDYELQDPTTGYLKIQTGYQGPRTFAFIDYVPNQPVPGDISRAATMIAAHSLGMALFPDRWGIESAQVDQRTKLQYTATGVLVAVPQFAADVITSWQRRIIT